MTNNPIRHTSETNTQQSQTRTHYDMHLLNYMLSTHTCTRAHTHNHTHTHTHTPPAHANMVEIEEL